MNKYDAVKQLIEANSGDINLGEYGAGDGPSQSQIAIVQKLLGVTFPPSYIWWLNNYGGGEIKGEEIFSIYETPGISGGDIVYVNELNRENGLINTSQLVIQYSDLNGIFFFDLSHPDLDGEYEVYNNPSEPRKYAHDFLDFLERRITDKY
ncbi:SMI1/KNR4 family protein [Mucilaginibacter flavus]|uniref:SMI1/KNR4 family protein n=1 Tax=Mucilaginibacter flavus TaxID=931504 RepID=UPI0025B46EE6|nr:SMI1/KNR4 family protein [Mucilaginibacter flavus]MDN3583227.1 SMI1/KNR4 family protein [Mucilaginibacter flavus]